jgi:hypothetical protein
MTADRIDAARSWIRRWHPWISVGVFVAAYLLYAVSNVVEDVRVLIGCGVLVLLSIMERLVDIKSAVADVLNRMETEQPLMSAWECMEDLRSRLQGASREEKVVLECLGLDMSHAWDHLKACIDDCPAGQIECKILIMTDNPARLGPNPPPEVLVWCGLVSSSVAYITSDVKRAGSALKKSKRKLSVSLRMYTGVPCVHGFRVSGPFDHCYVSFTGWDSPDYKSYGWGERGYLSIPESSTRATDRRFSSLLEGAFGHHWSLGSEEVMSYRNFGSTAKADGKANKPMQPDGPSGRR